MVVHGRHVDREKRVLTTNYPAHINRHNQYSSNSLSGPDINITISKRNSKRINKTQHFIA